MKRISEIAVALVVIALMASLLHRPRSMHSPVSLGLAGATREQAGKAIADQLGLEWLGQAGEDRIDVQLVDIPAAEVLDQTVGERWKVVGKQLMVFRVDYVPGGDIPEDCCRMEYLLEEAPAGEIVARLREVFPHVRFTPHPTMNGFYTPSGTKEDLLLIKRLMSSLDRTPIPEDVELTRTLEHISAETAASELLSHFPVVQFRFEGREIHLAGPLREAIQAWHELRRLDCLELQVKVSPEALRSAPDRCRFVQTPTRYEVVCPEGCKGRLHLLGLESGDSIFDDNFLRDREKPEWHLIRDNQRYRVLISVGR